MNNSTSNKTILANLGVSLTDNSPIQEVVGIINLDRDGNWAQGCTGFGCTGFGVRDMVILDAVTFTSHRLQDARIPNSKST